MSCSARAVLTLGLARLIRQRLRGHGVTNRLTTLAILVGSLFAASCETPPAHNTFPFPERWQVEGTYDAAIELEPDGVGRVENVVFRSGSGSTCELTDPLHTEVTWDPVNERLLRVEADGAILWIRPDAGRLSGDPKWEIAVFVNPCSRDENDTRWRKYYSTPD